MAQAREHSTLIILSMQRQSPQKLFRFGQAFKALQTVSINTTYADVRKEIKCVSEYLNNYNYKISAGVFEKAFKGILSDLEKNENQNTDTSRKIVLGQSLRDKIMQETAHAFRTIDVEAKYQELYLITEKRYSSEKLLEKVDSLFGVDVFLNLPEIAKFDFKEACSCILFERFTAAGFHLMRGSEAVIKNLYERKAGNSTRPGNGTWGDYENSLSRLNPVIPIEFLEQSRHIRRNFRNPTQHPEKRYDLDEVQDLLNLCIDLVNRAWKIQ